MLGRLDPLSWLMIATWNWELVYNYANHKTPRSNVASVPPEIPVHFTPTSRLWLNLVQR